MLAITAVDTGSAESAVAYETQQHGIPSLRSARGQPDGKDKHVVVMNCTFCFCFAFFFFRKKKRHKTSGHTFQVQVHGPIHCDCHRERFICTLFRVLHR